MSVFSNIYLNRGCHSGASSNAVFRVLSSTLVFLFALWLAGSASYAAGLGPAGQVELSDGTLVALADGTEHTFYFEGKCSDCTGYGIGAITLKAGSGRWTVEEFKYTSSLVYFDVGPATGVTNSTAQATGALGELYADEAALALGLSKCASLGLGCGQVYSFDASFTGFTGIPNPAFNAYQLVTDNSSGAWSIKTGNFAVGTVFPATSGFGIIHDVGTGFTWSLTRPASSDYSYPEGFVEPGSAAPEPSVWALISAGIGAMGAALRVRRRKAAV